MNALISPIAFTSIFSGLVKSNDVRPDFPTDIIPLSASRIDKMRKICDAFRYKGDIINIEIKDCIDSVKAAKEGAEKKRKPLEVRFISLSSASTALESAAIEEVDLLKQNE